VQRVTPAGRKNKKQKSAQWVETISQLNLLIYGSCEAGLNKHREHNNKTQSIEIQEHKNTKNGLPAGNYYY